MTRRKKIKKSQPRTPARAWYLEWAFDLGKTANTVSRKVSTTVTVAEKHLRAMKTSLDRAPRGKTRSRTGPRPFPERVSPLQQEIRDIAAISGLTAVIEEMNEIHLRHSGDPVIHRLLSRAVALSPGEQERLSRKFIERLNANPCFGQGLRAPLLHPKMTEEDSRKMADFFVGCFFQTLGDLGLSREDQERLQKISDEVMQPFHRWMQFYVNPRTFSQKMKRLWKMQRILMKMIKLIHMTKAIVPEAEGPASGPYAMEEGPFLPEVAAREGAGGAAFFTRALAMRTSSQERF